MDTKYKLARAITIIGLCLPIADQVAAQENLLFRFLPAGQHPVGFKIMTISDSNRIGIPEYNYLGEKNKGDRSRKITVHLWYPAKTNTGTRRTKYGDYCYHKLLSTTNEQVTEEGKINEINRWRQSIERFLGKASDDKWNELINTSTLAMEEAMPLRNTAPLLIGFMRPFTTALTNEFLASHGYVVAMIRKEEPGDDNWAKNARYEIPDMQFVISYLAKEYDFDRYRIGAFGFSGAGFVPLLFAMHDERVKAVADIESLMYFDRDNLFGLFAASDYYTPASLRVPFMHIFSRESFRQEKFTNEFENKTKFSTRYRLLLNLPGFSHGDFTMQGYAFPGTAKRSKGVQESIQRSFALFNLYLLQFFNANLKADESAALFLSSRPVLPQFDSSLWNITVFPAIKPAPTARELEYIVREKGIKEALSIIDATVKGDSSAGILNGSVLNNLGYTFLHEKKFEEAIGIFKLNTQFHPHDVNLFDSLAEAYEVSGDKDNMKKTSATVLALMEKKSQLTENEKLMKTLAAKRMMQ